MFTLTQSQLETMKGMDLNATIAFLKTIIDPLLKSGEITIEQFKEFAGKSSDAKIFIQSQADSRITEAIATGIKTWKEKHLDEEVEKLYQKKHPTETEADKTIRELIDRTKKLEDDKIKTTLENFTIKALQVAKLDIGWLVMIMADAEDEVAIGVNIKALQDRLENVLKIQKDAIYKNLGRQVQQSEEEGNLENTYGSNPWKKDSRNLTLQGKILTENQALAAVLMKQAGAI